MLRCASLFSALVWESSSQFQSVNGSPNICLRRTFNVSRHTLSLICREPSLDFKRISCEVMVSYSKYPTSLRQFVRLNSKVRAEVHFADRESSALNRISSPSTAQEPSSYGTS